MSAIELASTPLVSDANLVAYYKLENVNDSKGSNTLTNHNTATLAAGKFNNGVEFGSTNTNKRLSAGNLGIAGNGTIWLHCWAKVETAPTSGNLMAFVSHASGLSADRYLIGAYWNVGGTFKVRCGDFTSYVDYTTTLAIGTWYMLDFVRDNGAGNQYTLYINGSSVGTGVLGTDTDSSNEFNIGDDPPGYGCELSGMVDDVAVFSRIPTTTEISNLYNGTWGTTFPRTASVTVSNAAVGWTIH